MSPLLNPLVKVLKVIPKASRGLEDRRFRDAQRLSESLPLKPSLFDFCLCAKTLVTPKEFRDVRRAIKRF
jgi:hypothetical protein